MTQREQINEILDNFDFDKVEVVMKALDWKWWNSENSIPTKFEMQKKAASLLEDAYYEAKKWKVSHYLVGCGGFEATASYWEGEVRLGLSFVVAGWSTWD